MLYVKMLFPIKIKISTYLFDYWNVNNYLCTE